MRRRNITLTEGNIASSLVHMVWPMLFGMLGMVVFNLADTYFIGQVGVNELAALGFSFPVVMLVTSISLGMGIGTASLISRSIGGADHLTVRRYATSALFLGIMIILVFIAAGQLTIRPLFSVLGAEGEMLELIHDYMSIWYWGMIFVIIPMMGNNIIRATGDTFTPGMIMLLSASVNIVLDPFLIFGLGPFPVLSLKGAALATVFGRAMGMVLTLYILIKRDQLLTKNLPTRRDIFRIWGKVLYIAGPAAISILITPLSIGIITRIISRYGEPAVAAFGVVTRLEMFAMLFIHALGSVMIIFVGQNWGAGQKERILQGYRIGALFSVGWGLILFIVAQVFSHEIAGVFSDDMQVVDITAQYLGIVSFSYMFIGFLVLGISVFNGVNKPLPATGLTALRMVGLYVPTSVLAAWFWDIKGIFWAAFTANILTGILAYILVRAFLKRNTAS
ncbi:MAG: MATE family efflux transporter [candidate division KSB1 bacterium]|nr:MATE family efflux transporter [candidate division KSB1 bacterium]